MIEFVRGQASAIIKVISELGISDWIVPGTRKYESLCKTLMTQGIQHLEYPHMIEKFTAFEQGLSKFFQNPQGPIDVESSFCLTQNLADSQSFHSAWVGPVGMNGNYHIERSLTGNTQYKCRFQKQQRRKMKRTNPALVVELS